MKRVKVLVVDDHPLLRQGVVDILSEAEDIEVVGEAADGAQAVEMARTLLPQVVVLDLQMPGVGGLAATSVIHTELPTVRVLVFTVSESEADLSTAMRYGARGYIVKNAGVEDLVQAVHHIALGGVIVSPIMGEKLLAELKTAPEIDTVREGHLSPREAEVLTLIAKGDTNKVIAATLFISEHTVKTHVRNIIEKLHSVNRSQAAAYAARVGLISPTDPKSHPRQ